MKSVPMLSGAFLQPAGQSLPEPLLAVRNERAAALADMPMPTRKTENWKYSSKYLKLTEDMAATLPATEKTSNLDVPGYRIVLNNGAINRADSQYPDQGGISVQHFSDLDRKSTRLNSSHVKISYAVFCLKKKIYTQYQHKKQHHFWVIAFTGQHDSEYLHL